MRFLNKRPQEISKIFAPGVRFELKQLALVYYHNGEELHQSLANVYESGTLVDPETDEDLVPSHAIVTDMED